jgi:hypothetical protein
MDGADARTRLHGDDGLGHQRHVDDDAIARLHAQRAQRIAESADLGVQLAVGEAPHGAAFRLEDQCGFVAPLRQMDIQAVVRGVELPVGEPAIVRRGAGVQRPRERFVPVQVVAREFCPETFRVAGRVLVEPPQLLRIRRRGCRKCRWRREAAGLGKRGLYGFVGHAVVIA